MDTLVSQMSEEEGEDPVISVTDHDKEIMKLKGEIEESRVQITQLKQCLQVQHACWSGFPLLHLF